MRVAMHFASLASVSMTLGLMRWPSIHWELAKAYSVASPEQRPVFDAVFLGLWNPLEMILGSVWWLGIGRLLRGERPWLASLSLILGSFALLDAAGRILNNTAVFAVGLSGVLLLIPIWALVFGLSLLRQPTSSEAISMAAGQAHAG